MRTDRWIGLWTVGLLAAAWLGGCLVPQNTPTSPALTASAVPNPVPTRTPVTAFTALPLPTAPPENPPEGHALNEVPLSTPFDATVEAMIAGARADLAARLAVDPGRIELVSASAVTWPDGSLGCPQPGMMYTQITVDGMRIRLRVGGQTYEYHSGGARPPFLCVPALK